MSKHRTVNGMFPDGHSTFDGPRWLYAIGLTDGRVKIGVTQKPRIRIAQLAAQTRLTILWSHLFAPLDSRHARLAERKVTVVCGEIAAPVPGTLEWFTGLGKAEFIAIVRAAIEGSRNERGDPPRLVKKSHMDQEVSSAAPAATSRAGASPPSLPLTARGVGAAFSHKRRPK